MPKQLAIDLSRALGLDVDHVHDLPQVQRRVLHAPHRQAHAVLEQPVELTSLPGKYTAFATDFITAQSKAEKPFFLYVPFSHVHTTSDAKAEGYACLRQSERRETL